MTKFLLETLALIVVLFVGTWLFLHYGDNFVFRTVDAKVVGELPAGYPDFEHQCKGILYSTREPIEFRLTDEGDLELRCPIRLFPIVQIIRIENPSGRNRR